MQTQNSKTISINGTSSLGSNDKMMELPIFKHFSESEITKKVDSFRKGEKGLFSILKLIFFGALGVAFFMFALPKIMVMVGATIGAILSVAAVVLAIIFAPVGVRWMRKLARTMHKNLIKSDPFGQLERERVKMLENQQQFRAATGKVAQLRSDMETESVKSEKDATKLQTDILVIQGQVEKMKNALEDMVKTQGVAARETDEYVNLNSEYIKALSKSDVVRNKLIQAKDFVTKYGTRASIMKKFTHKLKMVETSMEIKISDFDATVEILKKDFEFASKSRMATESAKSAMLFTKSWELEYALDVVTSTIAEDIAITSGNLRDIDSMTQFNVNSDELYINLNLLADGIKVGENVVPKAKTYANPDYVLTQNDRVHSGGLDNVF